jgi:hypothetical protein
MGCAKLMSICSAALAVAAEVLGLFLLPNGRPWQRLAGIDDEATSVEVSSLFFFASSRAAAAALLHHYGITHIDNANISHGDQQTRISGKNKETLDAYGGRRCGGAT